MLITTVNVNGIRAACKQRSEENLGFNPWLMDNGSDVVLLQEVRATEAEARSVLAPVIDAGWHYYAAPAAAKGRAGVGILSKQELRDVSIGVPNFEDAGRYIQGTYDDGGQPVVVASLYLPSGEARSDKQDEKYRFLDVFEDFLTEAATTNTHMVIGGDWNICHREQDLKNFQSNRKSSGFLADERAFMDQTFGTFPDAETQITDAGDWLGSVEYRSRKRRKAAKNPQWFDVARRLHPDDAPYTWWTYRGQAFANDAGWRIDYQAATQAMLDRAASTTVFKAADRSLRWSDHAPLMVDYQ
ncbi:MAG: exodeoxyribonuclease III [Corynebacterium sp.]|nr:exodeoxyribonuclease III [Corynebacterium sp.]